MTVRRLDAFLNVPYDREYEALYIALVAGLCAFGLKPRATLELPGPQRRLDRVVSLEPSADQLHAMHRVVRLAARDIRRRYGTLYGARAFTELAYAATNAARELQ